MLRAELGPMCEPARAASLVDVTRREGDGAHVLGREEDCCANGDTPWQEEGHLQKDDDLGENDARREGRIVFHGDRLVNALAGAFERRRADGAGQRGLESIVRYGR